MIDKKNKIHLFVSLNVAITIAAALLIFYANLLVQGPMIQADEGSYLANAAAIAGYPNDMASSYHAGYSILISPAFRATDSPQSVWMAVKAINAILFASIFILLSLIARKLNPTASWQNRLGVAALVLVYPMWVIMAGYSFAQIAFVPLYLLMFLTFLHTIRGGLIAWIILGVVSGFLYWIHPTGVVPIIAISIVGLYIAWSRRIYASLLALLLAIILMVFIYKHAFTPWLYEQMSVSGLHPNIHYPSLLHTLSPLMTINGIKEVITRTAGQLFYLSVGTVGLFWLGIFSYTARALNSFTQKNIDKIIRDRAIALFIWLTLLGMIILPSLMFSSTPDAQRLDHWMYGRYVESVIAPILLAGAFSVSFRNALWAVPIAVICALLLSTGLDNYTHVARFNISAFWQDFWLREKGLWYWLLGGSALIIITACVPRRISMVAIVLIFSYSSYLQIKWHVAAAKNASNRWAAAFLVRDQFKPETCVGFDHSGIDSYIKHVFWFDFSFLLFDYNLKRMSYAQWLSTCEGPLFSYASNLDELNAGVYSFPVSPKGGPMIWVKEKPTGELSYPMIVAGRSASLLRALRSGWYDLESSHVWSGSSAKLELPIPDRCGSEQCSAVLTLSIYGASESRPVNVYFGAELDVKLPLISLDVRNSSPQKVAIPLYSEHPVQNLYIKVPNAISPNALRGANDKRVLGVALYTIELSTSLEGISNNSLIREE